jgi:hypothetical protein
MPCGPCARAQQRQRPQHSRRPQAQPTHADAMMRCCCATRLCLVRRNLHNRRSRAAHLAIEGLQVQLALGASWCRRGRSCHGRCHAAAAAAAAAAAVCGFCTRPGSRSVQATGGWGWQGSCCLPCHSTHFLAGVGHEITLLLLRAAGCAARAERAIETRVGSRWSVNTVIACTNVAA